ncbi:MAG TPA: hypothetical protein VNQ76_04265 [Planctomicrobium sp.]|nr:hypothetical protein [Planctomicrobium sp.]
MTIATTPLEISRGWCYPRPVQRLAERLLTQQIWCFGQDIKSPHGNLLIEYGFQRHRGNSSQRAGSTCYRYDDEHRHINLWGFGLFYGERKLGGLYLGRFKFQPQWACVESLAQGIHWPEKLPAFSRPGQADEWRRAHQLCRRMLNWIADYEAWVIRHSGMDYRRTCLNEWPRRACDAGQIAACWRFLSRRSWEEESSDWESQLSTLSERS